MRSASGGPDSARCHSTPSTRGSCPGQTGHASPVRVATMTPTARRMFELVEPIGVIPYSADEPNEAMFALGFTDYWDTYFAGRAAPLGLVAAEVVDAALLQLRSRRGGSPHPEGVAHHHARSGDRRSSGGLREGAAADPRRSRRRSRLRPRRRTVAQGGDQRPVRGPTHVRRAARHPDPRRRGGSPLPRGLLAARAPRRRAHRGPDGRRCRRPRGACAVRPRHGHAGGEVRAHPPPSGRAARRRGGRDARSRPDRG